LLSDESCTFTCNKIYFVVFKEKGKENNSIGESLPLASCNILLNKIISILVIVCYWHGGGRLACACGYREGQGSSLDSLSAPVR
jgi:hypothetical protein